MEKNCLLLTSANSDTLMKVKVLCEQRSIALNYTHTVLTFFERYYELMPNIIVVDSVCDSFLMKETLSEVPSIFANSIIISEDGKTLQKQYPRLKNMTVVGLDDFEKALCEKVEMVDAGSMCSLENYEGKRLNDKVLEELNKLIMKQNLKGYSILKELVICACLNRYSSLTTMTQMYTIVSRKFNISIDCLERNIRTVINDSYHKKDSKLKEIFPARIPTNKQLLIYLVEKLLVDAKDFREKTNNNIQYYNNRKH